MKKFLFVIFSIFTFSLSFAHEPIVTVNDLKDGRIEVIGGFSNGESAQGVDFYILKDKPYNGALDTFDGKLVLFYTTFPENNKIVVPKPNTAKYIIVFDAGPGHDKFIDGPALTKEEKESWKKFVNEIEDAEYKKLMQLD